MYDQFVLSEITITSLPEDNSLTVEAVSLGELLINAFVEIIIWELGGSFDLSFCIAVKNDESNMKNSFKN